MMADRELNEDYLRSEKKRWCHEKDTCTQLAQLLICIQHANSITDMWGTIASEFDRKGHMVQVDLH